MNIKKIMEKIELHSPVSIGMRTFKTWLATVITGIIGLTPFTLNPFYALMGAVFGMQNTVSNSFKMGVGRIIGTAVGASIGFVFAHFHLDSPLAVGFAIAIVIIICGILKIRHAILITVTLCLLIIFNPNRDGGLLYYTTRRTMDTALGVIIAVVINRFVAPPNHLKALITTLDGLTSLITDVSKNVDKLPTLKKELTLLATIHANYQADKKYEKNPVSNENLCHTVDACGELYFHLKNAQKSSQKTVKNYHENEIKKTFVLLQKTLDELKGDN